MEIIIKHNLEQDKVLECSKNILEHLRTEHAGKITNIVEVWTGYTSEFSFRFKSMSIRGTIQVNSDNIKITGKLPMAAMLFKGLIEETIRREANKLVKECASDTV